MIISFTNVIGAIRSLGEAARVITTNLKMWLGFETSETIGKNIYDGNITSPINGGTFTNNGDGTFTVTGDGNPSPGIGVRDNDAEYLTVGGTYKFSAQGANTTVAVYDVSYNLLTSGINSVEFQATTSSIKLYISPTNGVTATYSDVEVKELTQITPDKSGNNNVGELFTGKALDFDGSTDYVNTTGFEMSGTSATFAFWIYPKDTAYQFVMDLDGTVRTILGLFNGGSGQVFAFFNFGFKQFGTPTQNQWQRVVFRVNATTVECYVDGVKSGSTLALTSSIDLSSVANSVIGGRFDTSNTGNRFDGSLSDFQIYDAYWSTDDIAYDYANPQNLVTDRDGTSIELTNLKGYWHLSEGAGSIAYDSSGEGNNGTINGATYEPAQPRIPQLGMMNWSKGSNLLTYSEDFSQSVWIKNQLTQTYGFASPTGQLNATKLIATNTDPYILFTLSGASTDRTYSASAYIKGTASTIGEDVRLWIIKDNSVFHSQDFTLTSDWQRISTTKTFTSDVSTSILFRFDTPDTNVGVSDEVFVWATQLEKSSSASAYRLTDGGATLNSTVISNPTIPTKDILGNAVRDRLNSFNLDGIGYAEVADDTTLQFGTGAFTMECWLTAKFVQQNSTGTNTAVSFGGDSAANGSAGILLSSTKIRFYVSNSLCESNSNFVTDDWYHVVGTRDDSGNCKLYIDSTLQSDTEVDTGSVTSQSSVKFIGKDTNVNRFYNGIVSDVRFYDRALSSTEIENNYNAGLSAHTN